MDVSTFTSQDNITESEGHSSHHGKEPNLSPEESHAKSKDITSAKTESGKNDSLQSSMGCSDKDKLGSIPEHSEGEEEPDKEDNSQLQKGLGVEISLCGNMLRPGMGRESAEEVFQQHLISEEDFKSSGLSIMKKLKPYRQISHVILGKAVFGSDFCIEPTDAIPIEQKETPTSREDSLGMSPSSRRWRLWNIPFRISRSLQRSNSDTSEDIFLDSESVLSPMDEQAPEQSISQSPRKQFVRTLIPTSEQVASLNLKEGQNLVTFSSQPGYLGSNRSGHAFGGRDWSQSGVARLFSAIKDGKALPNGPVVISPDGLFPSLFREVIRRSPTRVQDCLFGALFPSDYNPFYAGFGNRDTDELTYKKMGIPKGKIFIINPKGEVAVNSSVDVKSYTSLHTLVNDMFPPTTLVEQEDYNSWNYWKMPLPDVDL
ncbi:hypothetical protein EJB05_30194 [Eragrostis curvula]|uniref:LNS2/PITP domain-containing protein n=1 Tax=Eragrostis curvula TaxID=38414 RepID=A0A5J9UHI6_9POAL|nr:hypothetical protein EJB05_30194 [Eragrostis curvula]